MARASGPDASLLGMVLLSWLYLGIMWVLSLGLLALELAALVDALRRPPAAFEAHFKKTKGFWLALLAGAALVGVLSLPGVARLGIFIMMLAVIPAGVYLTDVKPALGGRSAGW